MLLPQILKYASLTIFFTPIIHCGKHKQMCFNHLIEEWLCAKKRCKGQRDWLPGWIGLQLLQLLLQFDLHLHQLVILLQD